MLTSSISITGAYYPSTALTKPDQNSYFLFCNLSTICFVEKEKKVDNGIRAKVFKENSASDPRCVLCIAAPAETSTIEVTTPVKRRIFSDSDNTWLSSDLRISDLGNSDLEYSDMIGSL